MRFRMKNSGEGLLKNNRINTERGAKAMSNITETYSFASEEQFINDQGHPDLFASTSMDRLPQPVKDDLTGKCRETVVVLVKRNKPGEKATFVKLEPIQQASETQQEEIDIQDRLSSGQRKREYKRRRIIPPIVKKPKEPKQVSRRGRPPKVPGGTSAQRKRQEVVNELPRTAADRPKRTTKAPKRYGDYYDAMEPTKEHDDDNESLSDSAERRSSSPPSKRPRKVESNDDDTDVFDEASDSTESQDSSGNAEDSESVLQEDVGNKHRGKYAETSASTSGKVMCDFCSRTFANPSSLNAHRFKVHKVIIRASVRCPGCEHKATTIRTLNEHISRFHGVKLKRLKRKFKSTDDFQKFLDTLAAEQNMAFVRHRKTENKRQLYCNRSGAVRLKEDSDSKSRPRKGSAKIGAMCPAYLFYTECDDGSVDVEGQLEHFGHTLDPRFVFPATSSEKVTSRIKPLFDKSESIKSMYGHVPLDLDEPKGSATNDGFPEMLNTNEGESVDDDVDEHEAEKVDEERLNAELGPPHPKAEEIDIRLKNIDRLCTFLFANISEQVYRLDDSTMDLLLRMLRSTQNSISNLNSLIIHIGEGDPTLIDRYRRRGPKYNAWTPGPGQNPERTEQTNRRRIRQIYDTDDYDEDTVYYRHVPLRRSGNFKRDDDESSPFIENEEDIVESYPDF